MRIYNLSSLILTPLEEMVLGLGIKYIPLPKTSPETLSTSVHLALDKLHRKLRLAFHFNDSSDPTPTSIPKNTTKAEWNPEKTVADVYIHKYIQDLKTTATQNLKSSRSYFNNLDQLMLTTLRRLARNTDIIIKPADKNLGLVILNTTAYKAMCLQHLEDTTTYEPVAKYFPGLVFARLRTLLKKHDKLLHHWQKDKTAPTLSPLAESLLQLEKSPSLRIPVFYCIPKIHKTLVNPPGRPIVSSCSTATYHASVYLDKELQPILRKLNTICTSSRQLLRDIAGLYPKKDSVILCADVTALYPNIPIDLGVATVRNVITQLNIFPEKHVDFLMELLTFVLKNNFCTFDKKVYHQVKGTAMGTPTAVTYSTIFLYGVEYSKLEKVNYILYTRYIDDVFAIFLTKEDANTFVADFNSFCSSIKFEALTIGRTGIMLDLELSLSHTIFRNYPYDKITSKIYQKERNIYQYIPTLSEHRPSLFSNFVLQELTRYRLACSTDEDYADISNSFATRLEARGYDPSIFTKALTLVPPRVDLMLRIPDPDKVVIKKFEKGNPIISLCVPRLDPFIPWSKLLRIPDIIASHPIFQQNYRSARVLVGTINPRTIGSYLIRSLFEFST
jgi:hypothetical protein